MRQMSEEMNELIVSLSRNMRRIFRKSVVNCEIPLETTRPMADKQSENIPRSSMSSEVTMAEVDEQSEWVRRTVQETPNMSPPPRNVVVIKRRIFKKMETFFSKDIQEMS
ncbi:hypothetical protein SNEBB_008449 [Seison nebaliae]|nr:hypothetical protein SNEBB_008449 [Seison nebaliae]